MQTPGHTDLRSTVDGHVAVIDAVANGKVDDAISASDRLMDFVDTMFDALERDVPPNLLDCSLDTEDIYFGLPPSPGGAR
jgi:hypothetical protein